MLRGNEDVRPGPETSCLVGLRETVYNMKVKTWSVGDQKCRNLRSPGGAYYCS